MSRDPVPKGGEAALAPPAPGLRWLAKETSAEHPVPSCKRVNRGELKGGPSNRLRAEVVA